MAPPSVLCATLEVALNRYLALDPAALKECAVLAGKRIALAIDAPAWVFALEFDAGGVRVLAGDDGEAADVTVRGGLATLMRLAWTISRRESAIPQGLTVDGDVEVLRRFNRALGRVGFDAEEFAANFVGDAAAHRLGQGVQTLFGWGRRSLATLGLDTAEFLREETGDLAHADDVREWAEQVETLRDDVERLEARLRRLENRT